MARLSRAYLFETGNPSRLLAFLGERQFLPQAYRSGVTFVLNMPLRQSFFCGDYSVAGKLGCPLCPSQRLGILPLPNAGRGA